ncbi:ABC transporter permease [Streptosporangium saharense]|uniref:ABC-type nitrate/sulfonate/bicarbonate transport system permease component n=1 Tax=Streptosporangium saharense TaxID=1706840 RepID=A0A7W7VLR8_9ACTN|nr:ABC transporter permease subunit [Streptosporangium saharense]MBB4915046.1 ABC-type nitrate/sulfonate/bicarbonate transport system permease component [Streptosporangium saharense]
MATQTIARPAPARAARSARLLPVAGVTAFALLWEVAARTGVLPASVVPPLSGTAVRLGTLLTEPAFWAAAADTTLAWAAGLAASVLLAVPAGILIGTSERAYRFFRVPIEALRPVPPIVVLPLALLLIGGGLEFKVVLIAQGAAWPLLMQTLYGVRTTEPLLLETARAYRLDAPRRLVLIRLASAAPLVATGLRLAAATAFGVCLVTELVGGASGIGALLVLAQSGDDLVGVYAVTLLAGLAGLGIAALFGWVERLVGARLAGA